MKIDNILNKEKSPDKATTASIEDIKKSQKYFDYTELPSANSINNNLLQERNYFDILPPTTSKLKRLLDQGYLEKSLSVSPVKNNHQVKVNNNSNVAKAKKGAGKQKLFLCSECDEHFLKLHLFNHIKTVHNKFTCLYCYGFFVDVGALEKHLVKKHKVQNTSFFDEDSLAGFARTADDREVKAVCCKCAELFTVGHGEISRHGCGTENIIQSQNQNSLPVEDTQRIIENSLHQQTTEMAQELRLPVGMDVQPMEETQFSMENDYQPAPLLPTPPLENSYQHQYDRSYERFSPAKEESHCDPEVPPQHHLPNHEEYPEEASSQDPQQKLVVPKLTLKIPKAFQNYNDVESDEDSGDEGSSSAPSHFSSLSDSCEEVNEPAKPSLKLKIKNLASNNPESVLEVEPEAEKDVDMTECPMDLEQEQIQKEPEPEKIVIDGIIVTPADDDVMTQNVHFDESLDKIPIVKLMKICLRVAFPFCLYCNHARKIVVNGKALGTHFITHHKFHATVDSITAEELHPEKIVSKLVASMDELSTCLFNLDTFDNHDDDKKEGHVTISHDKLYECFQCRFQTPIHKELYLHNRKMHQKSLINCLMCKMSFYSYSELLCHICPGVPHKQLFLDYKFYCCLCNLDNIPSAFRLMVHLRKKHYACDVCLEKCSDQSKLSSHVWKHKLFHLCYRCNVCYRNKADIMKHLFWKHGTEGILCKKCLQKKWPHVYHFCIPPAAFTCQTCEMSFTKAMALNIHMRLHEDGAKYPCTEAECEKKFVSKKLLLRHVERHQLELTGKGTVMIPEEIPEGCCTRTIPVVLRRLVKKPLIKKPKEEEVKPEVEPTPEPKTLPDLPETNLNLSESSDSDSSDGEIDANNDRRIESLAALLEAQIDDSMKSNEDDNKPQELAKISTLSDSEVEDEEKPEKLEEKPKTPPPEPEPEAAKPVEPEEIEDKLPEKIELHVCQSDHDYAQLYRPPGADLEEKIKAAKIEKKPKVKKIKKPSDPNNDFSSSSSSGGSSSSSSSSSGSSSSSSGSSSDSSSSEASNNELGKPRNKKFSKKRSKKAQKEKPEPEEPEVPKDPDDIIYESDLVTDETDTDEDFYDEHPLKLDTQISEKRKQLLKGGVIDGIVENSCPSTPSLPPDEKIEKKKSKKKKKDRKRSQSMILNPADTSMNYASFTQAPEVSRITSTPVSIVPPRIELHQANQIRKLLQSTHQQPVLPILKDPTHHHHQDYINVSSHVPSIASSATSSRKNSDSESGNIKRSQRKRIPNKFYGYTSDDESMANQLAGNDPFKPIPPPQLTWRKEDLPSKGLLTPKVAPLKLNFGASGDQLQQQLQSFAVDTKMNSFSYESPPNISVPPKPAAANDTDSSDDDQLHISEPKRKKRKMPPSMYAFHTLETPPTVSQPPIPRLKLTISNNKIRRRNINPLKTPSTVKKRKLNNTATPARVFQPPPPKQDKPMTSKQSTVLQMLEKQLKLEVAILNTQQYFQRFNYTQVASSEVPQDPDGDGRVYCYCRRPYDDLQGMIGCDGPNCQIEWFHFECVGILVPPKGNWYCPECQKEQPSSATQ